jgi:hypothetical protein
MTELRKGLPPLPDRVKTLPIDGRGYPIPYFCATLPDGERIFNACDPTKRVLCVNDRKCWICGGQLGRYLAFVLGPMCAVNRNTSEPASHRDCALFAVQACPFLILPKSDYKAPVPGSTVAPGAIAGNPGACCVWITETYRPYRAEDTFLIRVGEPVEVLWYAEGKPATRAQIMESFDRRLPLLQEVAREHGEEAALAAQVERTMALLPT